MPEGSVVVNPLQLNSKDHVALKATVKIERPALDGVMRRLATHAADRYDKPVVPWSLAYVLTNSLAGKRLPDSSARRLAASIVLSLDSAFVCRETSTPLRKSAQFRAYTMTTYELLLKAGVNRRNADIVTENLIFAGDMIVHPCSLYRPL